MNKFIKIVLILAVAGLISLIFQITLTRKYADWLPADGEITDIQFHHYSGGRRHSGGDSYRICYDYTVEGVRYSGTDIYSGRETERFIGERVTVWYDPQNHQDVSFHPPGPGLYTVMPFIFAFPVVMRVILTKNTTKKGRKHLGTNHR